MFPASNPEGFGTADATNGEAKKQKKVLERELTIAIQEADSLRRKANPPMQCAP
jgi:hypothetical protein